MKNKNKETLEYGKSTFYSGDSGKEYFIRQMKNAELGAKLNVAKFQKWVGSEDRVLDFGCSGGWLLKELNPTLKVGVELNTLHHEYCENNGVTVYQEVTAVKESDFSRIISHHCLEHVPYPVSALKSLAVLLKEDGYLILVVPVDDWRVQRDPRAKDNDHHLHTWTPLLMKNTLAESGFDLVESRILTHAWPRKWQSLYRALPLPIFDTFCWGWSILTKRRQLLVVAKLK